MLDVAEPIRADAYGQQEWVILDLLGTPPCMLTCCHLQWRLTLAK